MKFKPSYIRRKHSIPFLLLSDVLDRLDNGKVCTDKLKCNEISIQIVSYWSHLYKSPNVVAVLPIPLSPPAYVY